MTVKKEIGQVGLFKVVDAFRTYREEIGQTCKKKADILRLLEAKTGLLISDAVVNRGLEALELKLEDVITINRDPTKGPHSNDVKTLAMSLAKLYKELGTTPSAAFVECFERRTGDKFPGIPAATVPPAKTIATVK